MPQVNAIHAVARLMSATVAGAEPGAVHRQLVREARDVLSVSAALLVALETGEGVAQVVAAEPDAETTHPRVPIRAIPALAELLDLKRTSTRAGGDQARALAEALGASVAPGLAVVLPIRTAEAVDHALILLDGPGRSLEPADGRRRRGVRLGVRRGARPDAARRRADRARRPAGRARPRGQDAQ